LIIVPQIPLPVRGDANDTSRFRLFLNYRIRVV
jgi:hypothetical protein